MARHRLVVMTIAATLALAGCGQSADGYHFDRKEYDRETVVVHKVEYRRLSDLRRAAPDHVRRQWVRDGVTEGAWSTLNPDGSCTMHVIDPTVDYQPQWFGHEGAHCFYGEWHP